MPTFSSKNHIAHHKQDADFVNKFPQTTAKLLGHAVYLLWSHKDQREALFGNLDLMPNAIEEILRYEAPSQFQGRVALKESEWHGVTIPTGARVALVTGAACRDEREYDAARWRSRLRQRFGVLDRGDRE